ncbi:hypothetical protein PGB90_004368 [Kerria lacca]
MEELIEIDGSILEGGGQILRLAMSFSSLLKKNIKINRIRAGRSKGGLGPQHLKGYYILSIGLIIQIALPIALFGSSVSTLRLKGGTNADMAPPIDHTVNVFLPILKKFGGNCGCSVLRRGYFPKGGGEVELNISPVASLSSVSLTKFGSVVHIWGRSYVAGILPINMAHEMADAANHILKKIITSRIQINIERVKESPKDAFGNGSGIVCVFNILFAETDTGCILGGSAVGARNVSTKDVGNKAALELVTAIQGEYCVDQYTQDQIIILMALANGKSVVKCGPITLHTKTAIYIAEKMTQAKFKLHENETEAGLLECDGIGLRNNYR